MTKTLKKLGGLLLGPLMALTFLTGLAAPARATNADDLITRRLAARQFWVHMSSSNSNLMNVYYIGSATEAVVTITDSVIAYAPAGTADTGFGNAGTYDITLSTLDTLGELCDTIDALANYGCVLTGGKENDNSRLLRNQTAASGTNDLKAAGGFDVKVDTGGAAGGGFSGEAYVLRVGARPSSSSKSLVLRKCEWNVNVANNVKVYGKSSEFEPEVREHARTALSRDDTTEAWSEDVADDTAETWDFTGGVAEAGWKFAAGEHVVVSGGNGTGVQATANYLRCLFEER